jgi:hypothetical protein
VGRRYLYTSSQSMEDLHVFKDLPPALATRLAISVHRRIVARAPFINQLSDVALLSVLSRLRPSIYVPSQVIYIEGHLLKSINFIKRGRVEIVRFMGTDKEVKLREAERDSNVGLDECASRCTRMHA